VTHRAEPFLSSAQAHLASFRSNQLQPGLLYNAEKVPNSHSPIQSLPVELLLSIFHECDSQIRARLPLTHTCRRWRHVGLHTASLWTHIVVVTSNGSANTGTLHKTTSLLRLQLDRVRGLPLEVYWTFHSSGYINLKMVEFLRKGAPFSQWKSLHVHLDELRQCSHEDIIFEPSDTFENLESLVLASVPPSSLVDTISRTATSKLKILNLHRLYHRDMGVISHICGDTLRHLSHLVLPPGFDAEVELILPINLVNLRAETRHTHTFPHITNYELSVCVFKPAFAIDLGNLTSLTVTVFFEIHADCQVILPSLRNIKFRLIRLGVSGRIEAPALETLHLFTDNTTAVDGTQLNAMLDALHHPGYLLSPNRLLTVDLYLPEDGVVKLLNKSAYVTEILLSFYSETMARLIWDCIFTGTFFALPGFTPTGKLCPRLRELRMRFQFVATETSHDRWRKRAFAAVEERRKSSPDLVPP
jgi:F-box-like